MKKLRQWLLRSQPAGVHLGLDLDQKRTQLVGLSLRDRGFTLTHGLDVPTPPGLFSDGRLVDVEEAARHLARLLQQNGLRTRTVALTLGLGDAYAKRQEVPRQERDSVLRGLRANPALQMADTGTANTVVGYHEVAREPGLAASTTLTVLAVAARKDAVRAVQQVAQAAGLEPGLVSVPPVALVNAWGLAHPERIAAGERSVLVHGGHAGVMILVLDGEVPVATHFAHVGLDALAERARQANPGAAAPETERGVFEESSAAIPGNVVDEWLGRIAQEVRRTTGATPRGRGPGATEAPRLWISGRIARVPHLRAGLAQALEAQVEVFDPLRTLHIPAPLPAEVFGPALALAVGVAAESLTLSQERHR